MFFEKTAAWLKKNRNNKYFYLRCFMMLLLSGIFSFHHYRIAVAFDPAAEPSAVKVFFAKGGFSEENSRILNGSGKVFHTMITSPVRAVRIDVDRPARASYDLTRLQINHISYSGRELYEMIHRYNFMQPELLGDVCRLHLCGPDGEVLQPGEPLPDLDYYISFRTRMPWNRMDFAGTFFFLKLLIFLAASVCVWLPVRVYEPLFSAAAKARRFLWQITPELLLSALILSFLLLRPCLHHFPLSEKMLFLLRSDVDVAFVILACAAICYAFRNWIAALILAGGLTAIYIFCFADCFLLYQFNTRICVIESVNWIKNLKWTLPIVWQSFRTHYAVFEYLIIVFTAALWSVVWFRSKKQNIRFLIFCVVLAGAGIIFRLTPVRQNLFELECKNVFAYGLSQKMYLPYSEEYLDTVEPFVLNYQQEQGKGLHRNTILLVVESLSSYQSKLFSGLDINNMPRFDQEIAKASSITRKHLASSYNTTCNTFALLTGFSPIHAPNVHFDFKNPKYYQNPLPEQFRKQGYETVFLKPAKQVDFMDVLLDYAKFDLIIGDDDPFYDNVPRYVFNSVSDDVLLDRVVEYVKTASPEKKFFVYTQTVSMHAPYFDHRTGQNSYEATVQTFDLIFPEFMRKLEETGFFERDGVLIVTGDHRAMVSISTAEQKKMGFYTQQYVPLAVFGNVPVKLDDSRHYNHVDLNYSLQWMMLDKAVRHPYQRNLFSAEQPDDFYCAFFQLRTNPSLVLFQTRDKKGEIRLNGDKTRIQGEGLTEEERQKINSFLVWSRTP